MTVLTTDAWAFALVVFMAMVASYTTLTLAVQVSTANVRAATCIVVLSSFTLGFGLWSTNLVQAVSFWGTDRPSFDGSWLLVSFAVAVSSQACALLFVACREPDTSNIVGSAFALAVGIAATRCAALDELPGPVVLHMDLSWVSVSFLLSFATFTGALWVWFKRRHDRSWQTVCLRLLASLVAGMGILGANAQTLANSRLVFNSCCDKPANAGQLLAITGAALGCAVLIVALAIAICCDKLKQRARRNARELEEVHARLQYLATHDSLTGLPNRQRFKDRLAKSIADTKRPGRAIAIAVLDLDHFSTINHSLGHGVGDWLLTEIARRITAAVSNSTTIARLDGDEFAILIDNVAARLEVQTVTAAIMADFEKPLRVNGMEVSVRSTIGVSVWPDDGRRSDDLLAHAEVAMTIAKERGGNRVLFFRPGMTDSMQERLALENDLRRALAAGEFELYYQPEISIKTGRIASAEALLRWRHPTKGIIGPSSFIALAEETGLIIPLGEWALREACRQARAWQIDMGTSFPVAVNLSATQFRHQNILQMIGSALADADLDARALEIELTESALMTNPEESAGVLKQLRRMGVSVAIDDFGTGYSSLSYLRRFSIDKLKIDRSFIVDLAINRTDESIVRAIVSLARSVGLRVVAEGIESVEQLELVTRLECDQWQGYHCCPPQPAACFEAMLVDRTGTRTGIVAALAALMARGTDA
jgi:diguanylate cyclase (GGDEF)-like protein